MRHILAYSVHTFIKKLNMNAINSISNSPISTMNFEETTLKMPLSKVFSPRDSSTLNEYHLFIAFHNYLPNRIVEKNIDCKSAIEWFSEIFCNEIKEEYFNKYYWGKNKSAEVDDRFYFIYEDLLVNFDTNNSIARFLFKKTDQTKVEELVEKIMKFRDVPEVGAEICLLVQSRHGISVESIEIAETNLSIEDNYNNDFYDINRQIIHRLKKDNDKGLVLLHGKPGTGKTSYIRYLVNTVKKKVIFLPPNMAAAITDPNLISVLIQNPNSILVIEDAENIIIDRNKDGNSPVSILLNLTDGLLADCLHIQIICSFNTDLSKVDSALLRKGRLIAKYEFKELDVCKAQALSDKLGFSSIIQRPTTLTEVYNQDDFDFGAVRNRVQVGFRPMLQS